MTPATLKALRIVRDNPDLRPAQFARLYWPKHEGARGWDQPHKCGQGTHRGMGMYTAAGGFLGKLRKRGLISGGFWPHGYHITRAGSQALLA